MIARTEILIHVPVEGVPLAVLRKRMNLRADLYDELDAAFEDMTKTGHVYYDSKGNLWKRSAS
jgi:hypothetical protein